MQPIKIKQKLKIKKFVFRCIIMSRTGKDRKIKDNHLIDRLIRHVLTLPVFTTTTKRAFSAMKVVKTKLHNKIEDKFLANSLVIYIEKGNWWELQFSFDT
jgi:hypothetical protein